MTNLKIRSRYRKLLKLAKISSNIIREFGFIFFFIAAFVELKKSKTSVFSPEPEDINQPTISEEATYRYWLHEHQVTKEVELIMKKELTTYSYKPKLGILISINDKNKQFLNETLLSITPQFYENWEVYLSYPTSIYKEIYEGASHVRDPRVVINSKIQPDSPKNVLSADFILFVNCGSILTQDALFRIIQLLNKNPEADIIYSDEDQLDSSAKRRNPFFKPDWSPELFLSMDYISNFFAVRSKLFNGSIRVNDEYGLAKHYDLLLRLAKHYDLLLRLTKITKKIFHIPTILISIRPQNDMNSIIDFEKNSVKAISKAMEDRNVIVDTSIDKRVIKNIILRTFRVKYLLQKKPKVSIIIPTRDNKNLLERCITSINKKTSYKNYEIIIVDNNSTKRDAIVYLNSLPYTIIKYDSPFNFSKLNNVAVTRASGDYLLFLNDDTAVLESDWLSEMVGLCEQNGIGVVGPKLVHSDNTIQHAGISFLKTGAGFHPMAGIDSNSSGYFGFLNVIRNCSAVTGACLLIKKKIFDEIGGFDDKFDMYYNDADLCMKVIKKGYRVVYTPYAVLLHQGSSTIKEQSSAFFTVENHYYFIKKWPILKEGDPFYNPNLGRDYKIDIST